MVFERGVHLIVGGNGTGKTALIESMLGFRLMDISSKILINNKPVAQTEIPYLHPKVTYTRKQSRLLNNMSVRENLLMGDPGASDGQVRRVCRTCGADEFVTQLPAGYDTIVGIGADNGSGRAIFSAGQVQRLVFARALLSNPAILIVDEALDALDPLSRHRILTYLARQDLLLIVISHDQTLNRLDRFSSVWEASSGNLHQLRKNDKIMAR